MSPANDDAIEAAWSKGPARYEGVRGGEMQRVLSSMHAVMRAATAIAATSGNRVLALTGRIEGPGVLPRSVAGHGAGFALRGLLPYTRTISTALLEVLDENALCAVIDGLQSAKGYRAEVYAPNGSRDPSYKL